MLFIKIIGNALILVKKKPTSGHDSNQGFEGVPTAEDVFELWENNN